MQDTDQAPQQGENPPIKPEPASRPAYSRGKALGISAILALAAGLVASLVAVLVMAFLRVVLGIPTPVELFGDFVLKHLQAGPFVDLLVRFSPNSKTAPQGLALLGMIALGTALGLIYAILTRLRLPLERGYRPGRREWLIALGMAVVMTLLAVLLFWNEVRQNFLGLPINWAITATALGLLVVFGLYAVTLCLSYRALLPKLASPTSTALAQSRRQLLTRTGVAALGLGAGAGSFGLIKAFLSNYAGYDGQKTIFRNGVTQTVTSNEDHYVVTQNTDDPTTNIDLWRLEVQGLINRPGTYTYSELQKLPSTSRAITLECIANGPGGRLMGNAIWQGITLRSLIEQHGGIQSGATFVSLYSVDGYNVSLPLNEVLAVDALIAWRMNGAELPMRHGYPLRALIPGRYGEENPKWLTRVELTDHFVGGLYSDQGWYNGMLRTTSRIDRPYGTVAVGSAVEVGGIAFAGARGIQKVEVSTNGGTTWNVAKLQAPLSQDSWVQWTYEWLPLIPGSATLLVRATDGTGELQTSKRQSTVPNGATGLHTIQVTVK